MLSVYLPSSTLMLMIQNDPVLLAFITLEVLPKSIFAAAEFSVPWITCLCSTRWHSNLQCNASWEYGRHDPLYVYCQQGEQIGYR